jgi:hypothetical protein
MAIIFQPFSNKMGYMIPSTRSSLGCYPTQDLNEACNPSIMLESLQIRICFGHMNEQNDGPLLIPIPFRPMWEQTCTLITVKEIIKATQQSQKPLPIKRKIRKTVLHSSFLLLHNFQSPHNR